MKIENMIYTTMEQKGSPVSQHWLVKATGEDTSSVKQALKALLRDKKIRKIRGKLYSLSAQKSGPLSTTVTGKIEAARDGYAFLVPDDGSEDIFIPARGLLGATHGDHVEVVKKRYRGRIEGQVVKVLERGITQIVCRVEKIRRRFFGVPMHRRFTNLLLLTGEEQFSEDDIILCKIDKAPAEGSYAQASVLLKLGHITDRGIENTIALYKYDLEREFPAVVLGEAAKRAESLPQNSDIKGKRDHRGLFTVTIDGETARDFDDAISVEKRGQDYTLYVHIADVAHYVKEGTPLDDDAYGRGTSVYFPEFAIPMLPEVLSNGACSLKPDEDRFTMTAEIEYSSKGERLSYIVYESVIRSNHRLTYTFANKVLEGQKADSKVQKLLSEAHELAQLIAKRRKKDGAVDIDLPEAEVDLDSEGNIIKIYPSERGESERIIENFMIEANEAVAETLHEHTKEAVYRNHEEPDEKKLITWAKTARSFGVPVGRIDKVTPLEVQRLFALIPDAPWAYMLKSSLVRSMQRAEYSNENKGHFGLASSFYTHFTSPIRRYPDLLVHRLLKHVIIKTGKNTIYKLLLATKHSSERERNAEDAEREVILYKKLSYMRNNPDNVYTATITKLFSGGFNIFIEDLLIYGTVDAASFPKGKGRRKQEALTEGSELEVQWFSTDIDRLEAYFIPWKAQ